MRSITSKLILSFVIVSLISILLLVLINYWRSVEEFRNFVVNQNRPSVSTNLTSYYQEHGSWEGVSPQILFRPPPNDQRPAPNERQPFTVADSTGLVVLAGEGHTLGEQISSSDINNGVPLQTNGKTVGTLLVNRTAVGTNAPGSQFFRRINETYLYSGLIAIILALALAIVLSRNLTRPILELTRATQAVAQGKLGLQVSVRSGDEMGELARSFNKMSVDLQRSTNARRQMTADIAHELRTPLSLILGHAEAIHDGVLPPTTENFEIIREEAGRLEHLVDDLRTLSLADAGELSFMPQIVSPQKLLQEVAGIYQYRVRQKNVSLGLRIESDLPDINVDPGRMTQVLTNILDNALRHSPDNGKIIFSAKKIMDGIEISVEDNGPGVPLEDLDHIFDRFYRADSARNRDDGGSGLGLAIGKSIVELHGGQIKAELATDHGLVIKILLPVKS